MENDSGAKIAIRGKGSVKEGKGRSDAAHSSNQEEDLHCLIMADTEEKVNKAKQLIHNVIETVRLFPNTFPRIDVDASNMLTFFLPSKRQLRSPKVKTSSSVTSFESLRRSTEPFETMKTRLVKTVVRLDTVNTTALSDKTLRQASSAEFVAMPATWLGIVQTASEAPIGVMTRAVALQVGSGVAMPSTVKWRYVWPFFTALF